MKMDDFRNSYNDSSLPLGSLAPGGSSTGNVETGGDIDYFAISLVAGRTYAFNLTGAPGGGGTLTDAYLELRNATGGYLAANGDANGTDDSQIVYTATAS